VTREAWGRQPHTYAQQRMRLGASALVTSPRSDLTTSAHDAPRLALSIRRGGRGIGDACEGATGRWVLVAPLAFEGFSLETFRAGAMLS